MEAADARKRVATVMASFLLGVLGLTEAGQDAGQELAQPGGQVGLSGSGSAAESTGPAAPRGYT